MFNSTQLLRETRIIIIIINNINNINKLTDGWIDGLGCRLLNNNNNNFYFIIRYSYYFELSASAKLSNTQNICILQK